MLWSAISTPTHDGRPTGGSIPRDGDRVDRVLRPQVPGVRAAFAAAVAQEEARAAVLTRLAEAERAREVTAEATRQAKLQSMGPCPAGYAWHREGGGWRCNGGSHTLSAGAAAAILGDA